MNPIIVIAGFIVILAVLIYYLQSKNTEPEAPSDLEKPEINVIKVRDYEAQYKAEMEKEKVSEEPVSEITESEPVTETDDIASLNGVGPKYQELLRAAGYTSIKTIAESNPEKLYKTLLKINEEKGITKRPPTLQNIQEWIKSATEPQ